MVSRTLKRELEDRNGRLKERKTHSVIA